MYHKEKSSHAFCIKITAHVLCLLFVFITQTKANSIYVHESGRVGIGTDDPVFDLGIHDTGGTYQHFTNDGTGQTNLDGFVIGVSTSGNANLMNKENTPMYFRTNNEVRMTIQNDGKVGIRRASPSYWLDVNGNARVTSLLESSDERLKKEIEQIQNPLEKLSLIRGVSYKWDDQSADNLSFSAMDVTKESEDNLDKTRLGLLAQEVEQVFPEVVYTDKDGMKAIAYSQMIGPMMEAIKSLHQQNKDQQTQIDTLRSELNALKALYQK